VIGPGVVLAAIEAAAGDLLAGDITAWSYLLGVLDHDGLAHAERETLHYRLMHLPSTITIPRLPAIPRNR